MSKRGRPRKPGDRYPSGKLKPTGEPVTPALWDRLRKDALKLAGAPQLASELGRLFLYKELTASQLAAGIKVAEVYGRYERLEGKRRSACSPSYELEYRGNAGRPEELIYDLEARIEREEGIKVAFSDTVEEIPVFPTYLRRLIEDLCVEDRAIPGQHLDDVRVILDRLARHFGITSSARKKPTGRRRQEAAPAETKSARREDFDQQAFLQVVGKLRPDLGKDELAGIFEIVRALKARAIFRRSKERKDNVVQLPRGEKHVGSS